MQADPQSIRSFLDVRRKEIEAAHQSGADSFATCAALTAMMDEALRAAFAAVEPGTGGDIAVLALGGYGRAELFPFSDLDVMVLCEPGASRETVSDRSRAFLHLLWDAGINVGHSVRTVDEAMSMRGTTLDAWASMLESRHVCGDAGLAHVLHQRMQEDAGNELQTWLIEGVISDSISRHVRYGSSVKLLEPNIKKSAGGLRDLHAVFWLYRGLHPDFSLPLDPARPASCWFLDHLLELGVLGQRERDAAIDAIRFLFRVRHEMHYQRKSQHDTLEYALQLRVAEGLGYGAGTGLRPVEVFMRDYYVHARTVHRLYQRLGRPYAERVQPVRYQPGAGTKAGSAFRLHDDVLALDAVGQVLDEPRQVLEAFVVAAENEVDLDFALRDAMERAAALMTDVDCQTPECASMFRRVLLSRRVAKSLHEMNEIGVLGRFIPEWAELVAFFQHNVYHFFTADEHTLIAVANAERLREKEGVLHEVFRNLRRKELLYLAIILHDIAKPLGVADHEITGVEVARRVLHRLGMDEAFPDVAFLVRNHLIMEQIAFRRNIHDPDTIKEFAARFERPYLLDYLFLLTYADLSAVNPNVWTEWKLAMLQDLYRRTAEVLTRDLHGEQVDEFHEARRLEAADRIIASLSANLSREVVQSHLDAMQNESYVALFSEEEIAAHIRASEIRDRLSVIFTHAAGSTDVTIVARDAPFALSRFCAVLAANDATIFDANVFTRTDGIIIDRFRVADAGSHKRLEPGVCDKIAQDMASVMEEKSDVGRLFKEHHRRWKRRPKQPSNPSTRTDVTFEDGPRYTIIDVYAPDSVGFLYRVTETMSRLELDIYFAKIATRVDGILDAFYVLDRAGKPLVDPGRRETVRSEILATIADLSRQELA